ncbi:hypothetical protein NXH67_15845 [Butyrivibrio sp. DSM 10294]|uniref:hypothetical protein n=1 Tax=Butyrivibrio sp. DSM 10294 TaxID=2972457 RepID=UPI00234F2436|nr:hypothetical protein [Butyrivibrio sp. DSM 10294]MDC7294984.1 hypothetical protein [Butyrivibrio sp. DSM 10294]
MANKQSTISNATANFLKNLQAIRLQEFKPSLRTLSSVDCGLDLSSCAFAGLRTWSK